MTRVNLPTRQFPFRYSTWFQWYKIFSMIEVGWYLITLCMRYRIFKKYMQIEKSINQNFYLVINIDLIVQLSTNVDMI